MAGIYGLNKWKWVAVFLLPSLIGMLVFIVYPIASSFWLSFQDWNLLNPPKAVALDNYTELFGDPDFWRAMGTTVKFILMYVPAVFVGGEALGQLWLFIVAPLIGAGIAGYLFRAKLLSAEG
mgnify:CR=1 FL=1